MLSDLALAAGVDDSVLGDSDHVRYPRIARIDTDELRRSGARIDLPKTGRRDGLIIDAGRRIAVVEEELARQVGSRLGPIVEPEEHAVVIGP